MIVMEYILYPYIGFFCNSCNINFGMTSKEITSLLGITVKYSMETYTKSVMEYFDDFRVDYNKNGEAVAFEFFSPKYGSHADLIVESSGLASLKNKNLFDIKHEKLRKILMKSDSNIDDDGESIIALTLGFGIYHADSEDDKSECIIIFKKGYYDN